MKSGPATGWADCYSTYSQPKRDRNQPAKTVAVHPSVARVHRTLTRTTITAVPAMSSSTP